MARASLNCPSENTGPGGDPSKSITPSDSLVEFFSLRGAYRVGFRAYLMDVLRSEERFCHSMARGICSSSPPKFLLLETRSYLMAWRLSELHCSLSSKPPTDNRRLLPLLRLPKILNYFCG